MGCGLWPDVDLIRALPQTGADQLLKRRRVHEEVEMRRRIEEELRNRQPPRESGPTRNTVDGALLILLDMCRACNTAFGEFDGRPSTNC